ncbi:choline dehydrogenase [Colwellia sp. MB3u-70]|uniref:GMC family oxidoreductase n=1 Tax=unclassified Colwellia TaxID=196834 RepID=UPI0015F48626|nr:MULTISPECIES: choline dehydrogenase [unclassified Colwellia]MBA6292447.1 choline dehydrogenase [Colwellia sp. MB3u-8]MBA6308658.1 choline dehydrogenase [Colwellia sp. MB3u-70]
MKTFDFVIIGGGSAGCVLADKLSASGEHSVCLLEAGKADKNWLIHLPIGIIALLQNRSLNWQFNSDQEKTLNNREIFTPRGKTLGGSSSINAMLYVRGQQNDYDHWHSLGNPGWSFNDVLPYFKALEHQERGPDDFHGINGALNVADSVSKPAINENFMQSAIAAGYPENHDFNGASQEGIGYYQVTQKNGLRHSAAKAFLTPNLHRKNLTVITQTQVEKVVINDGIATGVRYKHHGKVQQIMANHEVILSAGAINSPQILMLSGVGPKAELAKHDIELVQALDGVGKNLQDHVDVLNVAQHNVSQVMALRPKSIWWGAKETLKFITKRTGLLTTVIAEAGGFIKSDPTLDEPDLQLHFVPAAMDDHGRNLKLLFTYGISLHVCLLRPKSRGTVTLNSNKIAQHPRIHMNMLDHQDDIDTMVKGVKIARKILSTSPLSLTHIKHIYPSEDCTTDQGIHQFLKEKCNTIYHPVGTCKMGQDELSVVDEQLKVRGIKQLRVVDASIMPTLISGNTNAPTMMIAAKAADMILAEHALAQDKDKDKVN